jgi:hypothetical protein
LGVVILGSGQNPRVATACAVNGDARGCHYLLGGIGMTLIGLPTRVPGETPGPACQTGLRQHLSAGTFLKVLPWLQVEYRMW